MRTNTGHNHTGTIEDADMTSILPIDPNKLRTVPYYKRRDDAVIPCQCIKIPAELSELIFYRKDGKWELVDNSAEIIEAWDKNPANANNKTQVIAADSPTP